MGIIYLLGTGFTIWMGVEAVRRGQASGWLWIIIAFGPVGAAIYFFSEFLDMRHLGLASGHGRKVSAEDLRRAQVDVQRLDNSAAWMGYASALRARKDYPRAVEAAQKAVERNAASVDAQYELGQALLDAGRAAEAVAPLRRVVDAHRQFDFDNALFLLAKAHGATGDNESARAELAELGGRSARPEYLYEWARVEGLLGHRDDAARALQRIIDEAELVPRYLQRDVRPWVRKARQALKRLGF